jgi:hypothetical protein
MASGLTFTVRHPENVAWDDRGRAMTVFDGDEMHLVEMLLVEELDPVVSEQRSAPADGAGG